MDGWGDDGTVVGGHQIAKRLQEARSDESCRAIVLRVNSPGGSVSGSDAILQELRRVRQDGIPVVVSMGPVAASGGYWIATECDRLLASKQTITGSIGVFGLLPNLRDIASGYGMYWDAVKTHKHSDIMSVSRPKSPEELAVIQEYVQSLYAKFVQLVATARKMDTDKVEMIAEGRVWTGIDARTAGLIDAFGGIEASVKQAAQLAQLGNDYEVVEVPQVETPLQALEEMFSVSAQTSSRTAQQRPSAFHKIKDEIQHNLSFLQSLNDPRHAYGVLPWYRRAFGFVD
jgi:protease-4